MMSMLDLVVIDVEILKIESACSLEKELVELIFMNLLLILYVIVTVMWSFDLRHQRHLVDGWSCFEYDL